jgi:hypothetical protein
MEPTNFSNLISLIESIDPFDFDKEQTKYSPFKKIYDNIYFYLIRYLIE